MQIKGFQKFTLIDYPGKIACTIFLYGCNFRCGFCHNPELVIENDKTGSFDKEEILNFLKRRKAQLEGVCFTGGEPLMTLEKNFLKKIKELGYKIKIDTNGSFPEKLEEFINEKLIDFVSMDIKTKREKYPEIVRANIEIEKIEKSIKLIPSLQDYEFRTTIVTPLHPIEDIIELAKWLNNLVGKKPKKYVLQGFKRAEKLIDPEFRKIKSTKEEYLKEIREKIKDYFEKTEIRV